MSLGQRIRRLFSSKSTAEEAARREEYGIPDRGQRELERDRRGTFAGSEGAEAAQDELEEFEPPRDRAP